ncbi:UNVERIFIED_CONTAM: hypothetical protein H355_001686 [Colinus virginianus]|nr:hypothetical protein H355_001686 [Colinus virginianus]
MEGPPVLGPSPREKRRSWALQSRCWRSTVREEEEEEEEEEVPPSSHHVPFPQPPELGGLPGSPSSSIETWLQQCGSHVEALLEERCSLGPYGRFQQVQALAATADAFFCLYSYVSKSPVLRISPSPLTRTDPGDPETRPPPSGPPILSPSERLRTAVSEMCLYTTPHPGGSLGTVVREVLERIRGGNFRFYPKDVRGWMGGGGWMLRGVGGHSDSSGFVEEPLPEQTTEDGGGTHTDDDDDDDDDDDEGSSEEASCSTRFRRRWMLRGVSGHSDSSGFVEEPLPEQTTISEVLDCCQADAEEILYDLGFVRSEPGAVARVPARFFSTPSRARGIDFQLFLKAQMQRLEMEDPCMMLANVKAIGRANEGALVDLADVVESLLRSLGDTLVGAVRLLIGGKASKMGNGGGWVLRL